MRPNQASLDRLSEFAKILAKSQVCDDKSWRLWRNSHEDLMERLFLYEKREGMPSIKYLVDVCSHKTLPLYLFNYTATAHNLLHLYPNGWTLPLRHCRGIVFSRTGKLIALPFPKFFNYDENGETRLIPNEPFEATQKQDRHLGIIFEYEGKLLLTTRGKFESPTSRIGSAMLDQYSRKHSWETIFPQDHTLLVEIIHPDTHVLTDYKSEEFIVIGALNRETLYDHSHAELLKWGNALGLSTTGIWSGNSIGELTVLMEDRSKENVEGFVVRFAECGLRIKFKFKNYIGKMVAAKLSYTYLLRRLADGNAEHMLETLEEELYDSARRMLGEIMLKVTAKMPSNTAAKQDRWHWQKLYELEPAETRTESFKEACRTFVKKRLKY